MTPSGYDGVRVTERDVREYLSQLPKATPVAQRVAADVGVDLRGLEGSGPGGRIVKQDISRAAQPPVSTQPLPVADVIEHVPLKGVRGIIAERMGTSVHTTARVTLVMEVDATEFVAARERIKAKVSKDWGFAPGYNDLLAKVVAVALRQFPYMNARLAPDAIEILGHVNIGMAVETDRGLLVPVIKDVDQKGLRQFGEDFRRMVDSARSGRSLPDDLSGGTFTITNLGMYDVDAFTPVINLPEAAILGVGRIAPKAVPRGNEIVIRQMWTLSSGLRSPPRRWRSCRTFPANDQVAHRRPGVVYCVYVRIDRKRKPVTSKVLTNLVGTFCNIFSLALYNRISVQWKTEIRLKQEE